MYRVDALTAVDGLPAQTERDATGADPHRYLPIGMSRRGRHHSATLSISAYTFVRHPRLSARVPITQEERLHLLICGGPW
jgi:hypothetical protein